MTDNVTISADLIDRLKSCKGGASILFNAHLHCRERLPSAHYYNTDPQAHIDFIGGKNTMDECDRRGTVIELVYYPDTPIGHHSFMHYDLGTLLEHVAEFMEAENDNE